jgi:hypothetical protein
MFNRTGLLLGLAFTVTAGSVRAAPMQSYYFAFTDTSKVMRGPHEFVVELTDPDKIAQARAIVTGDETHAVRIRGTIARGRTDYNEDWPFHLLPDSIEFFTDAIEVCDATPGYIEENLEFAGTDFLPGLAWCPWASRVVREVKI